AADDVLVRLLVAARSLALVRLAPRGDWMMAAGGAAFTTAMRMVDRVHRDTAHVRLAAEPARPAGLAQVDVRVVRVRHRTDRGEAGPKHTALLARDRTSVVEGARGDR